MCSFQRTRTRLGDGKLLQPTTYHFLQPYASAVHYELGYGRALPGSQLAVYENASQDVQTWEGMAH
jgi:hypothetical protein